MKPALWLVIDKHNKELPLCVGSIHEVARFEGVTIASVYKSVSDAKKKGILCKYVKIEGDPE